MNDKLLVAGGIPDSQLCTRIASSWVGLMAAGWWVVFCCGCSQPQTGSRDADLTFYGQVRLGADPVSEETNLKLMVRGDGIYWDRDRNNQIGPGERLDSAAELELFDSVNHTSYRIKNLRLARAVALVSEQEPQRLGLTVTCDQFPEFEQLGTLALSVNPQSEERIEFFGRQEFVFDDYQDGLLIGGESEIRINLGTVARSITGNSAGRQDDPVADHKPLDQNPFAILLPSPSGPFPQVEIVFETSDKQQLLKKTLDKAC